MSVPPFSVVIPAFNEAESVGPLIEELLATCAELPLAEVIVVDDASSDGTGDAAASRGGAATRGGADMPKLVVLRHSRNAGKSAAIHTGVEAASTNLVCTIDADGQNPPFEIARLAARLAEGLPDGVGLVAGQRTRRNDNKAKQLASRVANRLRARVLDDGTRDTACGFKMFRRDAFLRLPFFDNMHRYLPALFRRDGWGVAHLDVADRPRSAGVSKYSNLQRAAVGLFDLFGVAWLIRRRKRAALQAELILRERPNV